MTTIPETPVTHIESAREMIARIQAIRESISGGLSPLSVTERRRMGSSIAVPDRFIQTVIATLESAQHLGAAAQVDIGQLRDLLLFAQEYAGVADEMERTLAALRQVVSLKKVAAARLALRVYRIATSFNSAADRELLFPHIEAMKRDLGRAGRLKKPAEPPVTQSPPA